MTIELTYTIKHRYSYLSSLKNCFIQSSAAYIHLLFLKKTDKRNLESCRDGIKIGQIYDRVEILFPDKLVVGIQARANEAEKLPNHVQQIEWQPTKNHPA